ncbi:MAG TPA: tRNA uridine-5-carboxymethylaminomethyl(34) synthesis GTPase MnmE [Chloroflexota bacterium]|nr:tRNA uridine-5-carboxymethylaminomethyl(34) synthesis GTPase MnmE [Chloroflexota bacterium]
MESDTIVAVVTPPGEGGVGIVRASGPLSGALAESLFPRLRLPWPSHRLRHGDLVDPVSGRVLDQALGCLFRGPRSYTGEDVFEIHCHGSPLLLEAVLGTCLEQGCRAARPGEFTLRAFLAGRLDLSQAEAVLDLVRARTNAGLELAAGQLTGWLSGRVEPIRVELVGVLAHMEAMVDFVEDDIPPQADAATQDALRDAGTAIARLLEGAEQGIVLREGATLAIVGSPNVGKSSIMNGLLGQERSIVTAIAGTTRDTIQESLQVRGIPFRAVDTAGITRTDDLVEQIGIDRARSALRTSDIVLAVFDRSRPLNGEDDLVLQALAETASENERRRVVGALNKSDLPPRLGLQELATRVPGARLVECSALTVGGVDALRAALEEAALGASRHEMVVSNVRHQDALRRAGEALGVTLAGLKAGLPLDLISFDVRAAVQALGEITGANVTEELLDRIFRDFCIGK